MKTTSFLMLISGRSGSSYLRELVNQDSRIFMLGEMLVGKKDIKQKQIINNFFDGIMGQVNYQGKKAAIGFKTKLNDLADRQFLLESIKLNQPKIIINRRRNFLKQAISRARMLVLLDNTSKKYGKKHHSPKSQSDIVKPIEVDVDLICRSTINFEQRDQDLVDFSTSLNNQFTTIYYEDFAQNPQIAIKQLSEILDLKIEVDNYNITYKNTPDDLRKAISNYDELKARLENTKYLSMLQEF